MHPNIINKKKPEQVGLLDRTNKITCSLRTWLLRNRNAFL
jgi:hypothetical protein